VVDLVPDGEPAAFVAVGSARVDDQALAVEVDAAGFVLVDDCDLGDALERGKHPHVDRHGGAGLVEETVAESADDGLGVGAAVPSQELGYHAVAVARHASQASSSRVRLIRIAS